MQNDLNERRFDCGRFGLLCLRLCIVILITHVRYLIRCRRHIINDLSLLHFKAAMRVLRSTAHYLLLSRTLWKRPDRIRTEKGGEAADAHDKRHGEKTEPITCGGSTRIPFKHK